MIPPDCVLIVDWSGGNDRGPRPCRDAIWMGGWGGTAYYRNRAIAEDALHTRIDSALTGNRRILIGFDFAFATPAGFSRALTGADSPFALWSWIADRIEDSPRANTRFDVAGQMNAAFPGIGPFWGNGLARDIPHLPRRGSTRSFCWDPARRATERSAPGAFEIWQMSGAGAVGGQTMTGLPVLHRLRRHYAQHLAVWPWEQTDTAQIILAEIFPSLLAPEIARTCAQDPTLIRDAVQVTLLAQALSRLTPEDWQALSNMPFTEEGWILGAGRPDLLRRGLAS